MKDEPSAPLLAEDYLILDCPACAHGVKVPTDSLGLRMGCPFCREPLEVAKFEPAIKKLRGETDEEQEEKQKKPIPRQPLVFRSLRDDDIGIDENLEFADEYERRRLPTDAPVWDDEKLIDKNRKLDEARAGKNEEAGDAEKPANRLLTRKEQMFRTITIFVLSVSAIGVAVIAYSAIVRMTSVVATEGRTLKELPEAVRKKIAEVSRQQAEKPLSHFLTSAEEVAAVAIVEGFLEAKTNDDRLPYLRDPERVAPLLEEWYSKPENNITWPDGQVVLRRKQLDRGRYFIKLAINFAGLGHHIFVIEQTRDDLKLDWETATGYQPMPLAEFKERRPTTPTTFRVKLKASDYYNYQFRDRKAYRAVEVTYPGVKEFNFTGYIDLSQPWAAPLVQRIESGEAPSVIAQMQFPSGPVGDATQIEIVRIVEDSWWQ